ncbi:MAG: hypothetical protein ACQETE_07105 [Bacteroidota bacterium]
MAYSEADKKRLHTYEKIHLKKDQQELDPAGKLNALDGRDRRLWLMLLLNVVAVVFFGYSWYYDITQLNQYILVVLVVIFVANTGMIFYQKKQVNELREYLLDQLNS